MTSGQWIFKHIILLNEKCKNLPHKEKKGLYYVARNAGMSHTAFYDYREGKREPTLDNMMSIIKSLAEALGMAEERLLLDFYDRCYRE